MLVHMQMNGFETVCGRNLVTNGCLCYMCSGGTQRLGAVMYGEYNFS